MASRIAAFVLDFISICLLLTFPGLHEEFDDNGSDREVKPFPSRPVMVITLAASTLGAMLALVSMLWQHTASVAAATTAQSLGYGTVKSEVGAKALALGWVGFTFLALAAIFVLILYMSIPKLAGFDG